MKSRSSRACIADGFRLYLGQFKRIFRYTWVAAIGFAVVSGLFGTYFVTEYPRLMVALQTGQAGWTQLTATAATAGAGLLLQQAVCVLCWSYVFSMLAAHKATGEMPWAARAAHFDGRAAWRTLKAALWALPFAALAGGLMAAAGLMGGKLLSPTAATALTAVVAVVAVVAALPLCYVFYKYLLTPRLPFTAALGAGYAVGLRHMGTLTAVAVVASLVVTIVALLLSLPMQILYMANIEAQTGVLMGDPLGMPEYMPRMTAAVFTLASFLQAYVMMAEAFPLYYAYGSIEASEQERAQAMGKLKERSGK